ncbi:MAG TPA: FecR family protein [Steroidobacteraceae bacterium]
MNDERTRTGQDERSDGDLEALLLAAGARLQPPPEVAAQVRAAVEAEWRVTVAARQPRRRYTPWLAAAASVAALAAGVWLVAPQVMQGSTDVATVARVAGDVAVRHGQDASWQPLRAAATLQRGDEIRTAADGRVALRRTDGLDLRLDAATTVALNDADTARLTAGRIYVDAGVAGSAARDFVVATTLGQVRHLGTQYMAGIADGRLVVAVREGSVAVEDGREPVIARAGESLTIGSDGRVARGTVAPQQDDWAWAQSIVPEFAIEGRSLDEFLGWAARETGRQLVYASADAAREAEGIQLKGSVSGMTPEAAVAAVLTTTPSLQHRFAGSQLRIERASP